MMMMASRYLSKPTTAKRYYRSVGKTMGQYLGILEMSNNKVLTPVKYLGSFLLRNCRGCFGRTGSGKYTVPVKYLFFSLVKANL